MPRTLKNTVDRNEEFYYVIKHNAWGYMQWVPWATTWTKHIHKATKIKTLEETEKCVNNGTERLNLTFLKVKTTIEVV